MATPGGPLAAAEMDEVSQLAGESPSMVRFYKDFRQAPPLAELDAVRARGADPLLTWEPWAWGGGLDQPAYALDRITAGDFDARILQSPNAPYWGSTDLAGLYPGAVYVDVVALDGYNWGTSAAWSSWISPQDLFAPGIAQLRNLAPGTPILIAETASSEAGGSKADWNTGLVSYLAAQPDVMGFVWFHFQKEADWRLNSSASSASAFSSALLARRS